MLSSNVMQHQHVTSLDVTISVGFVRGIVMKEMAKRRKDWNTRSELDSVKVVVAALVPSTGYQAEIFLSSAPLKSPKEVGDEIQYNAVFPLKGRDSNGAPTRMIMPGLLQREKGSDPHAQFKRQTVELLITLVSGNEAFTLGKSTLMVTGEEVKTKQFDLPVDTTKSTVLKLQKKSTFPMKRTSSFSSKMSGRSKIGPTSFKFDRRRRKYQLEKDAVLRVYLKVSPSESYPRHPNGGGMAPVSSRYGQEPPLAMESHHNGIPKVITPSMGFEPEGLSTPSLVGYPPGSSAVVRSHSRGFSSPMQDYREQSGHSMRSQSNPKSPMPQTIQVNGSIYGGSAVQGGNPAPAYTGMPRTRSQSIPRQRANSSYGGQGGSAYGGSSYNNAGYGTSGSRGRTPSRAPSHSGHQQYGGSSYGAPRKPHVSQGNQYGGSSFQRAGSSQYRVRSQSPHVLNRNY